MRRMDEQTDKYSEVKVKWGAKAKQMSRRRARTRARARGSMELGKEGLELEIDRSDMQPGWLRTA